MEEGTILRWSSLPLVRLPASHRQLEKIGKPLGASLFFNLSQLHLLTRTALHAVAGLDHFQGKLLAAEAKAS